MDRFFTHIVFVVCVGVTIFSLSRAVLNDPGYLQVADKNGTERKEVTCPLIHRNRLSYNWQNKAFWMQDITALPVILANL
jgi:hypothetical protein